MKIIKRSGMEDTFDLQKIEAAIRKANDSVIDYEKLSEEKIADILKNVEKHSNLYFAAWTMSSQFQKEKSDSKKATAKPTEKVPTGLPSKLDQEQMDKMFELLVKPEIKNNKKKAAEKPTAKKNESTGYDSKETNSLDRLIDITAE